MNSNQRFQEALDRGLAFEQGQALEILHSIYPNCYIMNNKVDPTQSTDGQVLGPRLYRGKDREQSIIAPDFVMFSDGGEITWFDAKLKGTAYTNTKNNRKYFSLDRKKHDAYSKFPQFMKDNFFFLLKNERTRQIYLAKYSDNPDTIFFNNRYDVGNVPVYYLDSIIEVPITHDK